MGDKDKRSTILVRYGEIGLKGRIVRTRFEERLVSNMADVFIDAGIPCSFRRDRGHIYLYTGPEHEEALTARLPKIFGITSFSMAEEFEGDKKAIVSYIGARSKAILKDGDTFAIRSRRVGQHDFSSMDLARDAGEAVLEANDGRKIKVNLTAPDRELYIEVRNNRNYLYTEYIDGPGGMPVGTQGKAVAIIGDREGAVAAWLLLKRGCSVHCFMLDTSMEPLVEALRVWHPGLKAVLCKDPGIKVEDDAAIGEAIRYLRRIKGKALISARRDEPFKAKMPVFFPLFGMRPAEIEKLAKRIGL